MSPLTISTPCAASSFAFALDVLRVTPRTLYVPSFSAAAATDPPWRPVTPRIVSSLGIVKTCYYSSRDELKLVIGFLLLVCLNLLDEAPLRPFLISFNLQLYAF